MTGTRKPKSDERARDDDSAKAPRWRDGWRRRPFLCGLASSLMLMLCYPPLGLWPLAFVAPAPLIWLTNRPQPLDGPRPYFWLWCGSLIGWLILLQGIRIPHWALYFGWVALSSYVAAFAPLFVAISRTAIHRWRIPALIACPLAWLGLEMFRGRFLGGFAVGLAGHPLIAWRELIQIADLGGAYAVSLVVVIGATSLTLLIPRESQGWKSWPLIPITIVYGASWLYGSFQLKQHGRAESGPSVRVACLQSAQDVVFVGDPQRDVDIFTQCLEQAMRARQTHDDLRLIIWPESTFSAAKRDVILDGTPQAPDDVQIDPQRLMDALLWAIEDFAEHRSRTAKSVRGDENRNILQLVGTHSEVFGDHRPERMNTAMLIDPTGETKDRYFKNQRVMIGEYIPLGDQLPWIYRLSPMKGLTPGREPMAFAVDGVTFSPNICFESTVPQLLRRHMLELGEQGRPPDVLINLTNDGWFWRTAILDLHFACNVFRAVELRRPVLISANTGVTACLDSTGRTLARAPRGEVSYVTARVRPARTDQTVYLRFGDWAAWICIPFCLAVILSPLVGRRRA